MPARQPSAWAIRNHDEAVRHVWNRAMSRDVPADAGTGARTVRPLPYPYIGSQLVAASLPTRVSGLPQTMAAESATGRGERRRGAIDFALTSATPTTSAGSQRATACPVRTPRLGCAAAYKSLS